MKKRKNKSLNQLANLLLEKNTTEIMTELIGYTYTFPREDT